MLSIPGIIDRTVAKALQLALDDYYSTVLPNHRRDVCGLFAQLQRAIRETGWYTLATDDIRNFFPSLRICDVMDCHRVIFGPNLNQYRNEPTLLWLVETIIRGHEGPDRTVGLDQGNPYSPPASELTLHTLLDRPLGARGLGHPLLYRYVDNVNVLTSNAREGQQALREIQEILGPHELELKGEDGDPIDLRDLEHDRTVLGLQPYWRNGRLTFHIPDEAYAGLRQNLETVWDTANPIGAAHKVVSGWTRSYRPAFVDCDEADIIRRALDIAAEIGIREIRSDYLRTVTVSARESWLNECQVMDCGCMGQS